MAGAPDIFSFVTTELTGPFAGAVNQQVTSGLGLVGQGWLHAAAAALILSTCVLAILQRMSAGEVVLRALRLLVVSGILLHPVLYTQFVVTPIMTTIPNAIASVFSHGQATTVPQQFTAVSLAIDNIGNQLRAQCQPAYLYIPERVEIFLAGQLSDLMLVPQFGIYACVVVYGGLLVIAGTVALGLYAFDKTRPIAEAWGSFIIGQIFASILLSAVLQIIFVMDTGYMQQAGNLPLSTGGAGLNISEGISVLARIGGLLLLGFFMMVVAVVIAFGITRSGGFDPASIRSNVMRALSAGRF